MPRSLPSGRLIECSNIEPPRAVLLKLDLSSREIAAYELAAINAHLESALNSK